MFPNDFMLYWKDTVKNTKYSTVVNDTNEFRFLLQ